MKLLLDESVPRRFSRTVARSRSKARISLTLGGHEGRSASA